MAIVMSDPIREKLLNKHCVSEEEVVQCFANRAGSYLRDTREQHQSDPPTLWFIGETDRGRKLKVIFVPRDGNNYIRSAYEPNSSEFRIYEKFGY